MHSQPALSNQTPPLRMSRNGDDQYGFAVRLKLRVRLIAGDPKTRAADKKLILSFLRHIKAKEISLGQDGIATGRGARGGLTPPTHVQL